MYSMIGRDLGRGGIYASFAQMICWDQRKNIWLGFLLDIRVAVGTGSYPHMCWD